MHTLDETVHHRTLLHTVPRKFSYERVKDGDWAGWQRAFRRQLADLTGVTAIREANADVPLRIRTVEKRDMGSYMREKHYLLSEPGVEIPFYLLLPHWRTPPYPLVLTPHGHGRRGKEVYVGNFEDAEERDDSLNGERDIAMQAVGEGYAAIAMDVRGFWEMARKQDVEARNNNSCADLQRIALYFGRTLIGERVHDMGRLISYAETRPDIDASRIAITGNSGGGTVSLFTAALDERITVCVPGSYFCTVYDGLVAQDQCPCNIIPGLMTLGELYDVAGLVAPRPLLFVNGETDDIFPVAATRKAYLHLQRIYDAMGEGAKCGLFVGDGGHRYYKQPVWPFVHQYL